MGAGRSRVGNSNRWQRGCVKDRILRTDRLRRMLRRRVMTKEQREQVRRLRAQGKGYKRIGGMLGIPVGTVKSFCRREAGEMPPAPDGDGVERMPQALEQAGHVCPQCAKPVVRIPGRKKRVFWSDACRAASWRRQVRTGSGLSRCAGCGEPLYGHDRYRKFCSHACYIHSRFGKGEGG